MLIQLEGNIGGDAELKYTQDNRPFVTFSLRQAIYKKINEEYVDTYGYWMDCVWFHRFSTDAVKVLKKGASVQVNGEMRLEKWIDKQTGETKEKYRVIASSVTLRLNRVAQVSYTEKQAQPSTTNHTDNQNAVVEKTAQASDVNVDDFSADNQPF